MQLFKADVQRLAMGTTRLVICPAALGQEFLGDRLIQDFGSGGSVLRADLQFHATDQVGYEPVESNHVVIHEHASDPGGFQTALGKERFGEIAEFADGDELGRFVDIRSHTG